MQTKQLEKENKTVYGQSLLHMTITAIKILTEAAKILTV